VITGPVTQFQSRLDQRGYTWDEVEPCVVSRDGDLITVDETHYAYPHLRSQQPEPAGPGTELKKLLGWFGIVASEDCTCNSKALKMDQLGSQWVLDNIETVVGWLEEEASNRGGFTRLAFTRTGARSMILLACRKAEKQNRIVAT